MGLFQSKKSKWVDVVMPTSYEPAVTDEMLYAATDLYIQQHCRILYESIDLFLNSKYEETRKSRYALACKHYGALSKVRKFTDKRQRKVLDKAIDDFVKADDLYHHPNRADSAPAYNNRKKNKEEFWGGVAEEEFFVDFMDDIFKRKR